MNDFERINNLLDFYMPLLTVHQEKIMEMYYRENFSLNEIAEIQNVTKSAINDTIKRSVKLIEEYEEKLLLYKKFCERNHIYQHLQQFSEIAPFIEKLKKID